MSPRQHEKVYRIPGPVAIYYRPVDPWKRSGRGDGRISGLRSCTKLCEEKVKNLKLKRLMKENTTIKHEGRSRHVADEVCEEVSIVRGGIRETGRGMWRFSETSRGKPVLSCLPTSREPSIEAGLTRTRTPTTEYVSKHLGYTWLIRTRSQSAGLRCNHQKRECDYRSG